MPQYELGRSTEPPVWVPSAAGTMSSATAAPEPLDEPPGVWAGLCGLVVSGGAMPANSQVAVLPSITAPARRSSATAARAGGRRMALVDRRAEFGRHVERIDDVLDADRHAMQRAAVLRAIEHARLRERQIRIEIHPRFDDAVALSDPRYAVARHCFAR